VAVRDVSTAATQAVERVSQAAAETSGRFADLTDRLISSTERASALMDSLNRTVTKLESGTGSAGRFLSDPKLYKTLLEATEELAKLTKDLRELIRVWKAKGMRLKL
jgi:ABC-type transporter Mla subunit MlaD